MELTEKERIAIYDFLDCLWIDFCDHAKWWDYLSAEELDELEKKLQGIL